MLATFNLRNRNYIYQCADDDDDEQRRSDGVGGMGKVHGAPSAGAPEFQAKKLKIM